MGNQYSIYDEANNLLGVYNTNQEANVEIKRLQAEKGGSYYIVVEGKEYLRDHPEEAYEYIIHRKNA